MNKAHFNGQTSRQAKHARFETPAARPSDRTPLVVGGLVAILVVAVIAGGLLIVLSLGASESSSVAGAPANPVFTNGANVSPASVKTRYTPVEAVEGVVRLPVATFDDGQARFYSFVSAGKSIDFFVLKSSDGVVRAAFDACDVCWPAHKGYRQQGDLMICNNCGRQFPSVQINEVQGGCNPAPLKRALDGADLVIRSADIAAGASYF